MQGLFNQQGADPGAVYEEVATDPLAALHDDCVDVPVGLTQHGVDDLAFGPHDAVRFGVATQESGIEAGVEMEGVGDVAERRALQLRDAAHELPLAPSWRSFSQYW